MQIYCPMGYFRLMGPVVDGDLPVEQALAGGAPQRVGSYRFYFAERWEWSPEVERIHGYGPLGFATTAEVLALRRIG